MKGPGRYDHLCTYVRTQARAVGAIVVVIGAPDGPGFSAQLPSDVDGKAIAEMLRSMATLIERDHVLPKH